MHVWYFRFEEAQGIRSFADSRQRGQCWCGRTTCHHRGRSPSTGLDEGGPQMLTADEHGLWI